MTIKQMKKRRSVIIHQLCDMSKNGWRDAKMSDYQPLEAELRVLEEKLRG